MASKRTPGRRRATAPPARPAPPRGDDAPVGRGILSARLCHLGLGAILALGLGLRLWGLGWGLPNDLHHFSYHPDETPVLYAATPELGGLDLPAGQFLPHFYNYGTAYPYLVNIALSAGRALGFIGPVMDTPETFDPRPWAAAHLAGRLVTALMGTATLWVVFAIGALLWGRLAGLMAALALALYPLHAQHSHFLTVDVPLTLWVALALLFACRLRRGVIGERRGIILGAVAAGVAAGTKYVGAMVLLAVVAAVIMRRRKARDAHAGRLAGALGLAVGVAAAAYLVTTPGTVLEYDLFLHQVRAMSLHMTGASPEIQFEGVGPGWVYIIWRNLGAGLGLPLLAAALAGVGYAVYRREPGDGVLASFGLPYYLFAGAAPSLYARYDIPLLPVLALWSGRFLADIILSASARLARAGVGAVVAAVFVFTLADTGFILAPMSQPDPRDRAAVWLAANAPPPTRIGFAARPWFGTPPLTPVFPFPAAGPFRAFASEEELARLVFDLERPFDAALLRAELPQVVVLSEFDYFDRLRLKDEAAADYLATLRREYRAPMVLKSTRPLLRRRSIGGLPTQDLPHDMLYPSPAILVFERAGL